MTDPTPSKEAAPRRRWSRLASEPNPAEPDDAKPLTPEELDVIRAMPVVNRNGSTIDRVDRLLATLDAEREDAALSLAAASSAARQANDAARANHEAVSKAYQDAIKELTNSPEALANLANRALHARVQTLEADAARASQPAPADPEPPVPDDIAADWYRKGWEAHAAYERQNAIIDARPAHAGVRDPEPHCDFDCHYCATEGATDLATLDRDPEEPRPDLAAALDVDSTFGAWVRWLIAVNPNAQDGDLMPEIRLRAATLAHPAPKEPREATDEPR